MLVRRLLGSVRRTLQDYGSVVTDTREARTYAVANERAAGTKQMTDPVQGGDLQLSTTAQQESYYASTSAVQSLVVE